MTDLIREARILVATQEVRRLVRELVAGGMRPEDVATALRAAEEDLRVLLGRRT